MQNRRCTGDTSIRCTSTIPDCNVAGGTCEFYWGGPLPIAASGVLACIVSQFDGPVSGTMNVESGEMATNVFLASRFYFGVSIDHPCPRCIGDATANDAVAGGTCDGGPRNDQTCDANGSVPGRPDYGATSLDCPPSPGGIFATLPIDISNATDPVTRTVSASSPSCSGRPGEKCLCDTCNNGTGEPCSANADCPDPPGPIGAICGGRRCLGGTNDGAACTFNSECPGSSCSRPGEPTLASYCHDDTATPGVLDCSDPDGDGEGGCTVGPVIVRCSVASGHAQRGCVADADCGGAAGSCEGVPGHCFLTGGFSGENGTNTLIADGMEDTPVRDVSHPTFGAVFCVAPTGSSNFDTVVGLPGAGRVTLKGSATARP
jgi:hypothetical protein